MKSRFITVSFLTALFVAASASVVSQADEIVEIHLHGRYYAEPATVQITVAVEPDEENRTLRVEAESGYMFRSSQITLDGASAARIHQLEFKNLPAGEYTLSAGVYSSTELRAVAHQPVTVSGSGMR